MTDAWKSIERAVAALVGGTRTWNSDLDIDVITDGWAVEVKNLTSPTVADLERILAHNAPKAASAGLKSALVVKRKGGRGRPTPYLAVFDLGALFAQVVDKNSNDEGDKS